ncbi:hypothetical protein LP032_077 [Listeria phage LP-032]|uniref:Uncharacterized protein n=2 Tax=Homburgvirus LP26 TaxID=1921126 RepID=A0A059TAD3_9CAUD|nr:hypothetical protein LP026_085 [Listeria phage LP-026]AHL18926.1 hypothetical protein LP032_077 [Listeria phage LP-032]AHN84779.1 hypothetical protein LP026_085 [Listeria phage LP-026]
MSIKYSLPKLRVGERLQSGRKAIFDFPQRNKKNVTRIRVWRNSKSDKLRAGVTGDSGREEWCAFLEEDETMLYIGELVWNE